MKTYELSVPVSIGQDRLADLLCSALEGGSNYWYQIVDYQKPESIDFRILGGEVIRHIDYPMNKGGAIYIDAGARYRLTLDLETLEKGLYEFAKKYPRHFKNFVNEEDDAETGDVFLQTCLFGEVVYG